VHESFREKMLTPTAHGAVNDLNEKELKSKAVPKSLKSRPLLPNSNARHRAMRYFK
jgi:hypothetical protein